MNTWVALNTTITLPGLYDLIEMQEAQRSWNQAALANLALAKDGQGQ